jgi:threonine/homoserine/homoserine lactone efflux protein
VISAQPGVDEGSALGLVVTALAVMGSPGPSTLSLVAVAATYELRSAVSYCLGLIVGTPAVLLAVATGVTALLLAVPMLRWVLVGLSAGYVVWLAVRLAMASGLGGHGVGGRQPSILGGVILGALNPKAWIAIAAVFASARLADETTLDGAVKVLLLSVMITVMWDGSSPGGSSPPAHCCGDHGLAFHPVEHAAWAGRRALRAVPSGGLRPSFPAAPRPGRPLLVTSTQGGEQRVPLRQWRTCKDPVGWDRGSREQDAPARPRWAWAHVHPDRIEQRGDDFDMVGDPVFDPRPVESPTGGRRWSRVTPRGPPQRKAALLGSLMAEDCSIDCPARWQHCRSCPHEPPRCPRLLTRAPASGSHSSSGRCR